MSWIEQIENRLIIITGDGKEYTPQWLNAKRSVDFNATIFNFPKVEGSLVDRRLPRGMKYGLELYFQGENHLDTGEAFRISANDKRYWILKHPFYGDLNVQPLSLAFDNSEYNVTKITGIVIETLIDVNPKTVIIAEDKIEEDAETVEGITEENFGNNVTLSSQDLNNLEAASEEFYVNAKDDIINDEDGQNFFNTLNSATAEINNVASDASAKIRSVKTVIQAPALFKQNIESRLSMLKSDFDSLQNIISGTAENILNLPNSTRNTYETLGGTVVASMCVTTVTPFDSEDYSSRVKISNTIQLIIDTYNTYISSLDVIQIGNGSDLDDFIANSASISAINDLVNFTVSSLFTIAFDAKQERFLTLETDTNFINLSHRLYGLKSDDSTIDELLRNNPQLGLSSLLNIKKNTEIIYYI